MTRLFSPCVATLLILAVGCGRSENASISDTEIAQLVATRAILKQAMLDRDIETIDRIYTAEYGLVTRKGSLRTRSERIGMIESGKLRYVRVGEESEVSIGTYGNVAVVRGVVGPSETTFDGERREPGARRFTEVWVYEDGKWREIGRQATAIVETEAQESFVGTWTLDSIEGKDESGTWAALQDRFGTDPVGYIMYDAGGHMSVQIMSRDRRPFTSKDRRDVTQEEAKDALLGFTAYFGTFSVDPEEKSITHHRIGHIVPNQATEEAKRFFHFDGNRLTLTLPGQDVRLAWNRL
jgi:hypothetical protein